MILIVDVRKEDRGLYSSRLEFEGEEAGREQLHDSISNAIRVRANGLLGGSVLFLEVTYKGMNSGTLLIDEAVKNAEPIAANLVGLVQHRDLSEDKRFLDT